MPSQTLKTTHQIQFLPHQHELHVTLSVTGLPGPGPVRLATPTWIPGAYGFMKYGRDVFKLEVREPRTGAVLVHRREGWSGFVVEAVSPSLEVRYTVLAYDPAWGELAGFVDHQQALFLATRCLYLPDFPGPCQVQFLVPEGWGLHHPSGATPLGDAAFEHPSHLAFLDCPVVLGAFDLHTRTCRGVPFHFVFLDRTVGFDTQVEPFLDALLGLAETCADLFGAFPFQDFTFIFTFDPRSHWGLEHANAATIGLGAGFFVDPKEFASGLRVSVHELFHAWNGCRLKPAPLGAPDLLHGGFPDALWITEGFTRYYEFLLCVRAGLLAPEVFFSNLVNYQRQLGSQPAAGRVSAVDSSCATFLNHNRYPGSVNSTIDYYDKGMLIAFDLEVALRTQGASDLDAETRELFHAFAGIGEGYTHAQARDFLVQRHPFLRELLHRETETVAPLGVEASLEALGFEVGVEALPCLGLVLAGNTGPALADVLDDSPAGAAGLAPGDELVGAAGFPFQLKALEWLIARRTAFTLDVLRGHRRLSFEVEPRARQRLTTLTWRGSPSQTERLQSWLQRKDFAPKSGDRILLDAFDNFHGIQTVL